MKVRDVKPERCQKVMAQCAQLEDAIPPRLTVTNAVRFEKNRAIFPAHRTIPIPPNLVQALREERTRSNSLFVVHDRDGHCVSLQAMKNIVAIINRRAPKTDRQLAKRAAREQELGRPIRRHVLKYRHRPGHQAGIHYDIAAVVGADFRGVFFLENI